MPSVPQFSEDIKVVNSHPNLPRLRSLPKVVTLKDIEARLESSSKVNSSLRNGYQFGDSPASDVSPPGSVVSPLPQLSPFSDGGAETDVTSPGLSVPGDCEVVVVSRIRSDTFWFR